MEFSIERRLKLFILIVLMTIPQINCGTCPSPESISPCTCYSNTIVCSGDQVINLKEIFTKISDINHRIEDKRFNEFVLANSAITDLEDHVFADIGFKKISITGAKSLRRISSLALNASAFTAEEFRHMGENSLSDQYIEQLFDALSSLVVVNRIYLDLTKATKIPDEAFKIINGRQSKLESIHMNYVGARQGSLQTVGNNPFYHLDGLRYISISNQPISYLSAKSFDFETASNHDLEIHLEATRINSQSFQQGIFLNAKRPLTVELSRNNITYLDQKIFKPVFEIEESKMVTIIVQENPLVCDCKMQWIFNDKSRLMYRVMEPQCKDKRSLWNLSVNDFSNC